MVCLIITVCCLPTLIYKQLAQVHNCHYRRCDYSTRSKPSIRPCSLQSLFRFLSQPIYSLPFLSPPVIYLFHFPRLFDDLTRRSRRCNFTISTYRSKSFSSRLSLYPLLYFPEFDFPPPNPSVLLALDPSKLPCHARSSPLPYLFRLIIRPLSRPLRSCCIRIS